MDAEFDQEMNFAHAKYQQRVILPALLGQETSARTEITVTPHPAGHMLGDAVRVISAGKMRLYTLQRSSIDLSVIYAIFSLRVHETKSLYS